VTLDLDLLRRAGALRMLAAVSRPERRPALLQEAVELFDVIHSVDRASLVEALAKAMAKQGRRPDCYVQVNIGEEPQKGGCAVAELPDLLRRCAERGVPVIGLMCIPPAGVEPAPYFALLAKLARRHGLEGLSMGMSDDFETAVAIGSTCVRIGTALFGPAREGGRGRLASRSRPGANGQRSTS
jgi:uncharacterized pyridoxal phosphate-containing UPF0001 family protein